MLKGRRILLRYPTLRDARSIYFYAKEPDIARYTTLPQPYTLAHAKSFLKRTVLSRHDKHAYRFAIIWKETGELIGMMGLESVDSVSKRAEIGYWLGKPYWGKGIMQEAISLLLDFGFKKLKLERIFAKVYHKNPASAHLLEKHGFTKEGTLRRHVFRNGEWLDEHHYGLLREEHHR